MDANIKCLDCMIRQGCRLSERLTPDLSQRKIINEEIIRYVNSLGKEHQKHSPAELSTPVYNIIKSLTGVDDPFYEQKILQNKNAMMIYPDIQKIINAAEDKLHAAAKMSVVGNAIDCGIDSNIISIENQIETEAKKPFAVDDFDKFKNSLKLAEALLLISDNAGEILFDKCLLEVIKKLFPEIKLYVSVKDSPILNDATIEDAKLVGIDKVAEIVTTGSGYIGIPPTLVSKEFKNLMKRVNIILAKGQGNFETLEGAGSKFFFLLKAKCPVIADYIGVEQDSYVFMKNRINKDLFDPDDF